MLSVEREIAPPKDRYVETKEEEVHEMPKESLAEKFFDLQKRFREKENDIKKLKNQLKKSNADKDNEHYNDD